jgi:hypothetical protein
MLSAKKYSLFVIPSPLKHQRNISVFNGNTPICRGNMDCVKIHPFRAVLPFVFPIIAKFFVVGFKNQVPHLCQCLKYVDRFRPKIQNKWQNGINSV